MAHRIHKKEGRSFGDGLSKGFQFVERGIQTAMALKGVYETGKAIYTLGRTVAPAVAAML